MKIQTYSEYVNEDRNASCLSPNWVNRINYFLTNKNGAPKKELVIYLDNSGSTREELKRIYNEIRVVNKANSARQKTYYTFNSEDGFVKQKSLQEVYANGGTMKFDEVVDQITTYTNSAFNIILTDAEYDPNYVKKFNRKFNGAVVLKDRIILMNTNPRNGHKKIPNFATESKECNEDAVNTMTLDDYVNQIVQEFYAKHEEYDPMLDINEVDTHKFLDDFEDFIDDYEGDD